MNGRSGSEFGIGVVRSGIEYSLYKLDHWLFIHAYFLPRSSGPQIGMLAAR